MKKWQRHMHRQASLKYPPDYKSKWIKFVEAHCKLCQYGQMEMVNYGFKSSLMYPNKCLYYNRKAKPIIRMYVLLNAKCPHMKKAEFGDKPIVASETKDHFSILL